MESLSTHRAVVEFIVGGAFQAYSMASGADAIILIDSQEEVSRVPERPRLLKIALGGQDTVLSLLERLQEDEPGVHSLLSEYRQCPGVHLGAGMAQDPRIGACAIQDLALRGDLGHLFEQIFIQVLEAVNGHLDLLVVRELHSNAGGMGAGGGPETVTTKSVSIRKFR